MHHTSLKLSLFIPTLTVAILLVTNVRFWFLICLTKQENVIGQIKFTTLLFKLPIVSM